MGFNSSVWTYLAAVLIVLLLGAVLSIGGYSKSSNYPGIKPKGSPPNWVFGVVWPILYVLMALAASLLETATEKDPIKRSLVRQLFIIQLVLNLMWTIAFVILRDYWLATVIAFIMLAVVLGWMVVAFSIDQAAGYMLLPLVIWLGYALYLSNSVSRVQAGYDIFGEVTNVKANVNISKNKTDVK